MTGVFTKQKDVLAPVSGRVVQSGSRKKGIVIIPSDIRIYAPISGVANISRSDADVIEIYLDTAHNSILLKGGAISRVKNGSRVRVGECIAAIDPMLIKSGGCMTQVRLLLVRDITPKYVDMEWVKGGGSVVLKIV